MWTHIEPIVNTCVQCACWRPGAAPADDGECRRFPPALDADQFWTWPATTEADWCAEFRPHPGDAP